MVTQPVRAPPSVGGYSDAARLPSLAESVEECENILDGTRPFFDSLTNEAL
jgi:hypothetical protein